MARSRDHYRVDVYDQKDPHSAPVLRPGASGTLVAYDDAEAIREAQLFVAQYKPTFIVVRNGDRVIHKSDAVFPDA